PPTVHRTVHKNRPHFPGDSRPSWRLWTVWTVLCAIDNYRADGLLHDAECLPGRGVPCSVSGVHPSWRAVRALAVASTAFAARRSGTRAARRQEIAPLRRRPPAPGTAARRRSSRHASLVVATPATGFHRSQTTDPANPRRSASPVRALLLRRRALARWRWL